MVIAAPAVATPRETLAHAAFVAPNAAEARRDVTSALAEADATLAQTPGDPEAQFQHALAIGYRAKLDRSASDAKLSRQLFEAYLAAHPSDAEAQLAVAGWHLDTIADLGQVMARIGLGASKSVGLAGLDRAVALGRGHALFPAYAALIRARLDPSDPAASSFARQAIAAPAPNPVDKAMQRRAALLLNSLQTDGGAASAKLARRLLPFGNFAA